MVHHNVMNTCTDDVTLTMEAHWQLILVNFMHIISAIFAKISV